MMSRSMLLALLVASLAVAGANDWSEDLGEALEAPQGVRRNPTTKKCEENPSLCLLKAILCDDPITKDVVRRQCPITCGVSGCEEKGVKCKDNTPVCSEFKKNCKDPSGITKRICQKTCGVCTPASVDPDFE